VHFIFLKKIFKISLNVCLTLLKKNKRKAIFFSLDNEITEENTAFKNEEALISPKINNLYNQKSIHTIDRFKRLGKYNLIFLAFVAIYLFIFGIIKEIPLIGSCMALLWLWLLSEGYKESVKLNTIDKGENSYEYVKSFHKWRVEAVDKFSKIYKVFYPVFGMFTLLFILHSNLFMHNSTQTNYQKIMSNPETLILFGLPIYYVIGTILFMIFLFLMSEPLYRLDIKLAYGKILKKLDKLLEDAEELRK